MKTFEEFNEQEKDFSKFCQKGDEIDEELFDYMTCYWLAPNYDDGIYAQNGEAYTSKETKKGSTYYYETFKRENDRYFYIGLRADMNRYKPKKHV